jgi:hypothetical protein
VHLVRSRVLISRTSHTRRTCGMAGSAHVIYSACVFLCLIHRICTCMSFTLRNTAGAGLAGSGHYWAYIYSETPPQAGPPDAAAPGEPLVPEGLQARPWCPRGAAAKGLCAASQARLSSTPLKHASQARLSSTPLKHASQARLSSMPLKHASQARLSSTPLKHASQARLSSTPVRWSTLALAHVRVDQSVTS